MIVLGDTYVSGTIIRKAKNIIILKFKLAVMSKGRG